MGRLAKKILSHDILLFFLLFTLFGAVLAYEHRSLYPFLFCWGFALLFIVAYKTIERIRSWWTFRKLTPEQSDRLFRSLTEEAKWNPDARERLNESFKGDKEK